MTESLPFSWSVFWSGVADMAGASYILPVLCFAAAFATDWCWTKYIKRAGEGAAFPAAAWSMAIYILSSLNVLAYTKNPWLLGPMIVGYFFGTYYAVKHDKKEKV